MSAFGVYVHVPFCAALCPYCDFAVVVGKRDLHETYCGALAREASAAAGLAPGAATSLFVGGGTPTFVDAGLLARTLGRVGAALPLAPGAEVTVEANPETVDAASMGALRAAGVTRVSIGAQSFQPHVLRALGRTHGPEATPRAVRAARDAGVGNLNLDLIYGAPGETIDDWLVTLEAAVALEPEHLSCYALAIEERTAFGRAVARGRMREPDQDDLARKYEGALETLDAAGYRHYEISNWALPGSECRHNLLYWGQGEYLGVGVGAHSHLGGARWWNSRSLRRYLEHPERAREGEERLGAHERAEEWLSLRLRTLEVDLDEAAAVLGRALDTRDLEAAGLVRLEGRTMRLTPRGMLLENEVALRLTLAA